MGFFFFFSLSWILLCNQGDAWRLMKVGCIQVILWKMHNFISNNRKIIYFYISVELSWFFSPCLRQVNRYKSILVWKVGLYEYIFFLLFTSSSRNEWWGLSPHLQSNSYKLIDAGRIFNLILFKDEVRLITFLKIILNNFSTFTLKRQ